ncbi:Aquaporin-1 [Varanus komodoensis]|nr:Aquaporin-1 [Varanus komodoensis]
MASAEQLQLFSRDELQFVQGQILNGQKPTGHVAWRKSAISLVNWELTSSFSVTTGPAVSSHLVAVKASVPGATGHNWNFEGLLADGLNSGQGLGIEIIATLQLVLCVLATTDRRRTDVTGSAPLAIGLSVALGHLLAIDYTGCGINPARSFGSALIANDFANHWIFWVGPIIGGAVAALIYEFILAPRTGNVTSRMKVWTSGHVEEYDLDADDSRVEMKPK